MRYYSIFSGIEAASVAWGPLGWEPLLFSEIEEFPSAVQRSAQMTGRSARCAARRLEWIMPTDDKRREVARRLRKLNESGICIEEQICDLWEIEGGSEYRCDERCDERCDKCRGHVLAYLADLIDPDCRNESFCKVCGHVIPDGWSECPRCKSKVVSDD